MLLEWNLEEAREAWFEKGREEGIEEIVRNAITKGIPLDLIKEITGMDINSIQNIQAELS